MTVVANPKTIPEWLTQLHVIDTDAHYTEPRDLWTSNAPAAYKDRVPHVEVIDGDEHWMFDGVPIATGRAVSVVLPDGKKAPSIRVYDLTPSQVHVASWDPKARVEMLDELGIWAQVLYPNVTGFGNQKFMASGDAKLRLLSAQVYNDVMARAQEESNGRLYPVALLPWWDVEASIVELRRIEKLGMRGIAMCSDPQDAGLPDLSNPHWDPLWKACAETGMPVSFHVGASDSAHENWQGTAPWPELSPEKKLLIGSSMIFMANARIIANFIIAGILDRFPDLKIVSVESGIGWLPYFLETLDYQYEDVPVPFLKLRPSEYFRRQIYACFWFERAAPQRMMDLIGVKNAMFETDVPHPTCLYPNVQEHIVSVFESVDPYVRRRVLQDNAAELYRIELPKAGAAR